MLSGAGGDRQMHLSSINPVNVNPFTIVVSNLLSLPCYSLARVNLSNLLNVIYSFWRTAARENNASVCFGPVRTDTLPWCHVAQSREQGVASGSLCCFSKRRQPVV